MGGHCPYLQQMTHFVENQLLSPENMDLFLLSQSPSQLSDAITFLGQPSQSLSDPSFKCVPSCSPFHPFLTHVTHVTNVIHLTVVTQPPDFGACSKTRVPSYVTHTLQRLSFQFDGPVDNLDLDLVQPQQHPRPPVARPCRLLPSTHGPS